MDFFLLMTSGHDHADSPSFVDASQLEKRLPHGAASVYLHLNAQIPTVGFWNFLSSFAISILPKMTY
jgi:hypothetical protein